MSGPPSPSEPDALGELRHELNNPLGRIMGYTERLMADAAENGRPEIVADLQRIQAAGLDLSALIAEKLVSVPGAGLPPPADVPGGDRLPAEVGYMLVVDDLVENRDLLARRLKQYGHRCREAEDGMTALSMLRAERFDIVLLDLMMPGIDGYEVLTRIKQDPNLANIPVIMISAMDEIDTTARCIELGAADYLTKPFNPILLRARIEACLREKRLRDLEATQMSALQQSYQREQQIADALQKPMLLPIPEDAFAGISIATLYVSAWREAEVGGDLYDAFMLPDGRIVLAVADASGKGLAAAVRVMQVKFVLRAFAREYTASPARAVERLNAFLCQAKLLDGEQEEAFITLVLAVLDASTGAMTLLSAGGEPPLIIRADGAMEPVPYNSLPLGIDPAAAYDLQETHLRQGDILMLCTDGITEARSGRELLGYDGMMELAESARQEPALVDMAGAILRGARDFSSGSLRDDACILLARRK